MKLVEIDLSQTCEKPGETGGFRWHPDIDPDRYYLAEIEAANGIRTGWPTDFPPGYYAGRFSEQWYGYNFDGWGGGGGLQLDKPGTNMSSWRRLWLIEPEEKQMNFELTQFAIDRHFDSSRAGTTINARPEDFQREARRSAMQPIALHDGYAPFCKLLFLRNWTDARTGTLPITPDNDLYLESEYKARTEEEFPVLVRWLELPIEKIPPAEFLCLVLYSKGQLKKEGTDIGDADYGVVAILGQMHDREEPMTPMTAMRNALGVNEGGSGVPIDREAYLRSVEFWNAHAAVKMKK